MYDWGKVADLASFAPEFAGPCRGQHAGSDVAVSIIRRGLLVFILLFDVLGDFL